MDEIPARDPAGAIPGVFVLSTGRCGSTALSLALRRHPAILSLSEYWMAVNTRAFTPKALSGAQFWAMLSRPRPLMSRILTPETAKQEFLYDYGPDAAGRAARFGPATIPPIMYMFLPHLPAASADALFDELASEIVTWPRAAIESQHRRLFDHLRRRFDRHLWVERSGASLIYAAGIIGRFKDARFVHLYRSGAETALSIRDYPPLAGMAATWAANRRFGLDLMRPPFRLGDSAALALLDRLFAPFSARDIGAAAKPSPELVGRFWSAMIETGVEAMAGLPPARLMSLSLDELTAAPERELTRIADFMLPDGAFGPANRAWAQAAAKDFAPPPLRAPRLDARAYARLLAACAPGEAALIRQRAWLGP